MSNLQDSSTPGAATAGVARAPRRTVLATRPLGRWRTVDIITAAMVGVAIGVGYYGWDQAYAVLSPVFKGFPPSSGLVGGTWLIAGVIGALVVRRPGAALLAEFAAAAVEMTLGGTWGGMTIVSGVVQGLGVEVALALLLYRRFGLAAAAAGGALAGAAESVFEWWAYYSEYSLGWKLAYTGTFALSGAVIAGVGGWILTRGLASTGALAAFPPGHEAIEARLR